MEDYTRCCAEGQRCPRERMRVCDQVRLCYSVRMTMKLLIATHNPGKLREYTALLAGLPLTLISPDALGIHLKVTESGTTYLENARLKARLRKLEALIEAPPEPSDEYTGPLDPPDPLDLTERPAPAPTAAGPEVDR